MELHKILFAAATAFPAVIFAYRGVATLLNSTRLDLDEDERRDERARGILGICVALFLLGTASLIAGIRV